MNYQSNVLFLEEWENQKLKWDDVEIIGGDIIQQHDNLLQQFLSQNDEPETDITVMNKNNPMFNASYANRSKQKNRTLNWKDVDLNAFNPKINQKNQIHDKTILKKPNLGRYPINSDINEILGIAGSSSELDIYGTSIDDDGINGNKTLLHLDVNSDDEYDIDTNNIIPNRKLSNPDMSRSFSHQLHTPIVNNTTSIPNFQGSSHRSISQRKRQINDTSSRNSSYNTPGHRNIR